MTPGARLQMAIDILEALEKTAQPTDRFLKSWFRIRRFAGSKDRRAIAEQVFSVQRSRARLAHGQRHAARAGDRRAAAR
jgi:16S rRNA (cytosine967-C5)-methyltransferase